MVPPLLLLSSPRNFAESPQDWSRDGRFLLYTNLHPETARDILYLEGSDTGDSWESRLFLSSSASEGFPRLSPNGRYIAYVSDESGQDEIYVQPFPNGSELFYVDPDNTLVAVDVLTAGEFTINRVTRLFQQASLASSRGARSRQNYDVSLDGQRFLVTESVDADAEPTAASESTIRVITN
jgi:Tol biopolymer transport system component